MPPIIWWISVCEYLFLATKRGIVKCHATWYTRAQKIHRRLVGGPRAAPLVTCAGTGKAAFVFKELLLHANYCYTSLSTSWRFAACSFLVVTFIAKTVIPLCCGSEDG